MKQHDEWFSSDDIEEQIEQHLYGQEHMSTNTRMLQDLQHLAADDVRRVADIRARLLEHIEGKLERSPALQDDQHAAMQPPRQPGSHRAKNPLQFPVKLVSGLVAVLLIGSMLFAFTRLGAHLERNRLNQQTPLATADVQDVHGRSVFLLDATSGKVLLDVNGHVRRPIACMATLMTALVAIEDANPDQSVIVEQATLNAVPEGVGTAKLQAGDRIPLHDLLYGLLLSPSDDIALVIAQAVGGNTGKFVSLMNDEAHQLQLNDTHFTDPYSSSSPDAYSSAADLARLASYAMQFSTFAHIVATQEYTLAATAQNHRYQWRSTNTLLAGDPGLSDIQSGYDARSGVCLVFSAHKNDHFLVGAELNTQSEKLPGTDVTKLLH